ncbi:hypothetical protein LARV_01776 [Longilinea arvoryzae]|uniref:Nbr1 FW domain-containing protein n=1 Tax=Longilinea arvoryzae TaxID=360412 RepID=A0A0S7BG23_9CHLR|nr:NBR1-Ig-like domain-containing protein [Longilinea arvoryzae]GAP14016.1 hypothetical protein LARV_01776 [Longilinea arvoryzae]
MSKKFVLMLSVSLLVLLALAACIPGMQPAATLSPELIGTLSAQTVVARLTEIARQTPETLPTQEPVVASPTVQVITPTPTNTSIPPTITPIPPTATPSLPCNAAQFVKDVTVSDGSVFKPGQTFTKTWRIKNIGSCNWSADYSIVFVSGNAMSGPSSVNINATVRPGEMIDLSVNLTAPSNTGDYTGNWALRTSSGTIFGIGQSHEESFWVKITVKVADTIVYNLADKGCDASWKSTVGGLTCPGSEDLTNGFVSKVNGPNTETGQENEAALVVAPSAGDGGYIEGRFPNFKIQNGDHFKTVIGCMASSPKCDVMFQVNISVEGGAVQSLGSWTQTSDKSLQKIDLDLSAYKDKNVSIILKVLNNGKAEDDRAFWLLPRILR